MFLLMMNTVLALDSFVWNDATIYSVKPDTIVTQHRLDFGSQTYFAKCEVQKILRSDHQWCDCHLSHLSFTRGQKCLSSDGSQVKVDKTSGNCHLTLKKYKDGSHSCFLMDDPRVPKKVTQVKGIPYIIKDQIRYIYEFDIDTIEPGYRMLDFNGDYAVKLYYGSDLNGETAYIVLFDAHGNEFTDKCVIGTPKESVFDDEGFLLTSTVRKNVAYVDYYGLKVALENLHPWKFGKLYSHPLCSIGNPPADTFVTRELIEMSSKYHNGDHVPVQYHVNVGPFNDVYHSEIFWNVVDFDHRRDWYVGWEPEPPLREFSVPLSPFGKIVKYKLNPFQWKLRAEAEKLPLILAWCDVDGLGSISFGDKVYTCEQKDPKPRYTRRTCLLSIDFSDMLKGPAALDPISCITV